MTTADLVLRDVRLAGTPRVRESLGAIVILGGRIVAMCDHDSAQEWIGRGTQVIGLGGRTVTAGLIDGHSHPVLALEMTQGVDLSELTSADQIRTALANGANSENEWVRGWGLDPNALDGMPLNSAFIDDVLGSRPAIVTMYDGHSTLVSAEALRRAGVTGPREFTSTAQIVCDDLGRPTGLLLEDPAMDLVEDIAPRPDFAMMRESLARLLAEMAATGLTGGHVMDSIRDSLDLYQSLDEDSELPMRLRVTPWLQPDDDDRRLAELIAMQSRGGRLWQVGGVKLFMDGTLDNGTAWLHDPDCHGESARSYWRDPQDYATAVGRLVAAGVPTATHAIGDAAVAHVLDTLAANRTRSPHLRHRIEHVEVVTADQLPRFANLNVVASMQPSHSTDHTRADHSDVWSRRLGSDRADRSFPFADLHNAGAVLAFGSDWPIASFDPRIGMAAAILCRHHERDEQVPVRPDQALTAAQALAGYTRGPAFIEGESHPGQIVVGARADLTVFDDDPLAVAPDQLPHLPVAMTVVDGIVRHRSTTLSY